MRTTKDKAVAARVRGWYGRAVLQVRSRRRSALLAVLVIALWSAYCLKNRGESSVEAGASSTKFDRERQSDEALHQFPPLDELRDRRRLWPPDLDTPLCRPKIYVYDIPIELQLPAESLSKCRWSAYNSELILYRLLVNPSPSAAASLAPHLEITTNPAEADLFFLPLFTACYLFNCWVDAGWPKVKTPRCGVEEDYILPVMEWVRAQGYLDERDDGNHIIPHPMDYADGYFTETARTAMNASTYLVTVGDNRPPPFSLHYRHHRDIVIPSATHLLNSYYVNPQDYVDEEGHPLHRPRGQGDAKAKVADPTRSEIYKTSAPNDRTATARSIWQRLVGSTGVNRPKRTTTAIFRGGVGRPGEDESYALSIRSLFFPSSSGNTSHPPFSRHIHAGFASIPSWDIAESSPNTAYALALSRSKFGLAPPGYTLDTTRLYEYLAFGVVPVFIGTGPHAGQVMPFAHDVDYDAFSLSVPRSRAHKLPQILEAVSEEEYERLRRGVWDVGRRLVIEEGRGNVWKGIVRDLCRLRRIGTGAGAEIANN